MGLDDGALNSYDGEFDALRVIRGGGNSNGFHCGGIVDLWHGVGDERATGIDHQRLVRIIGSIALLLASEFPCSSRPKRSMRPAN